MQFAFPPITPGVKLLLLTLAGAFAAQTLAGLFDPERVLTSLLALSPEGIKRLFLWQLVTYGLLHGGLMLLAMNAIGLYFFGGDVERALGTRGLIRYFLVCVIGGGLAFVLIGLLRGNHAYVVGASGGVLGLVLAFGVLFPNKQVFLFPLPFPLRARMVAIFFAVISLYSAIQSGAGDKVAHLAHLGGIVAGFIYLRFVMPRGPRAPRSPRLPLRFHLKRIFRKKPRFDVHEGGRSRGPYDVH